MLVVNDGSTDGGENTVNDLPLKRIDLTPNQGKGAAILAGASWAAAHGFSHIITLDADGQHDPRDAVRLMEKNREKSLGDRDWRAPHGAG